MMIGKKINKVEKNTERKKIYDNLHSGEVMLLHATSKDNANILDEVIKETKNKDILLKVWMNLKDRRFYE